MAENLLYVLHEAASELLRDGGFYPLMNYAWEGEDTPSAEYVGLAMWQLDAPFKPDWNLWDRTKPPREPSKRDEFFHRTGEDFVGVMDLAIRALAVAMYCYKYRKPDHILDHENEFWEYIAIAALWLNIASDRIRGYFVMGRFGVTAKKYGRDQEHTKYVHPFEQTNVETPEAAKALSELRPLATELAAMRKTRNRIVHNVASRRASNALRLLGRQREKARETPRIAGTVEGGKVNFGRMRETAKVLAASRDAELVEALALLKRWYMLLVKTGSLVFEFEYWKRIGR